MSRIPVHITQDNGERRLIGYKIGNQFVTFRTEAKHLYRGGLESVGAARRAGVAAWGLDCKALDGLMLHGVDTVKIVTDKAVYIGPAVLFKGEGLSKSEHFVLHHKPHRAQYFVLERCLMRAKKSTHDSSLAKEFKEDKKKWETAVPTATSSSASKTRK